jgi:hypothetical protein
LTGFTQRLLISSLQNSLPVERCRQHSRIDFGQSDRVMGLDPLLLTMVDFKINNLQSSVDA